MMMKGTSTTLLNLKRMMLMIIMKRMHSPLQEEIGELAVGMGQSSSNEHMQDLYHLHNGKSA